MAKIAAIWVTTRLKPTNLRLRNRIAHMLSITSPKRVPRTPRSTRSPRWKATFSEFSRSRTSAYRKDALNRSWRKFSRISGRPIRNANTDAMITNTYARNVIPRGISIPKIGSGPESSQRMSVNDTRDTSELIAPTPSVIESSGNERMSSWMRWSGLSTAVGV